jgi:CheY-like chemotaxis protein
MTALNQKKPIILLAEDSADDAFFFQRAFRKANLPCEVLHAENGKAAVEILARASSSNSAPGDLPFVIFLDLKMPVMTGFEVLEWLKASRLSPLPRVIVLSGSADQADRERALNLGAAHYLVKPISVDLLKEWVSTELAAWLQAPVITGASF